MSGVKYRAIYKNTTIDPPGTIAHCKEMGAEIMQPTIRFFELIEKSGFPTRRARFCCDVLKEYKILDISIQGIRRSESSNRAARYSESDPVICRIYGRKSNHVSVILPILGWSDEDVAEFIKERGIKCHSLYYDKDGSFHPERRLGCIGCPLSHKGAINDFIQYPKMLRLWIKAGKKWLEARPHCSSAKKFGNVYNLMYHNLFCESYADYKNKISQDLFGEQLDCKKELEKFFNVEL